MTRKHFPPTGFGQRLKELRELAGWTQLQLASAAGVTPFGVSKLEQGKAVPSWPMVLCLAKALGVSVVEFDTGAPTAANGHVVEPKRPRGRPRSKPKE